MNIFLLNGILNYPSTFYNQKANKSVHIMTFWKENAFISNRDIDHYMTMHCYPKENVGSWDLQSCQYRRKKLKSATDRFKVP